MLIAAILLLVHVHAQATTIFVTNTNDAGAGSLRAALAASASGDTIMFTASMLGGDNTIHLASGLGIAHDLVIIGLNDDNGTIFISGENAHRVLFVSTSSLVLEQIAIINGRATTGGAIYSPSGNTSIVCRNCYFGNNVATQRGGAIYFTSGNFELHGTTMDGNSAAIEGGAIYYELGNDLLLYNSTLTNNSSGQKGGGIYSKGGGLTSSFEVIRSSFYQNTSGAEGAAIFLEGRNFYMDSCTVNSNTCNGGVYRGIIHAELRSSIPTIVGYIYNTTVAQNTGIGIVSFITLNNSTSVSTDFEVVKSSVYNNTLGGIFSYATTSNANATSNLSITTSTISGNGGEVGSFGGIYSVGWILETFYNYTSHVTVTNSTVVNNTSDYGGSGIFSRGKLAASSYLGVKSSIVAGNSGINMMSFAPTSPITSLGYNVFGEASVLGSAGTDQLGIGTAAIDLRPIGNYGGHTPTMMPNQGSVTIDMGTPIDASAAQNGTVQGGRRDIGAAEYIPCTIQNAIAATLCGGDSVLFGGIYRKTTGTFVETVIVGACDSVVTLDLTVLPLITSTQSATICFGESHTTGTSTFTSSGTYTDVFAAANGCDSTRTLTLTVLPQIQTSLSQSICIGESFAGYTATGTYTDVFAAANGCDSTRTLNLTVLPVSQSSIAQTICFGESFEGYTATGTYTDVLTAANGCDSTRTLTLTVLPVSQSSIARTICSGEGFAGYTATGIYTDVFTAANGCDSTRTLTLTVLPASQSSIAQTVCFGESFAGYTATGIYTDVYVAANGCDSTRTLNLTVLPQLQTNLTESICFGESFEGYSASGTYTDVFANVNGCDSTRTLILTVLPVSQSSIAQTICSGESFAGYTVTGTYTDVFTAANGCDSTRTLTLNVLPVSQSSIAQTICSGESFAGYTATGTYTDVYVAANGCDSTRTLNLTVQPLFQTNLTESICFGESFAGYAATGTYTDVFTSINGCDSTRTLVLTVHDLPAPTITQNGPVLTTEAFTNYQWLLDGSAVQGATAQSHTAIANGDYTVLVTDANGCTAESDVLQMLQVSTASVPSAAARQLKVFPNPNNGQFSISFDGTMVRFSILDIRGKLVHDATLNTSLAQVNLTLPEGIYLLQVIAEDGILYYNVIFTK